MTDQSGPAAPTPGTAQAPALRALSQFVKDLSFENPAIALPEGQPNIDIGIDVSATPREDGQSVYETSLKMKARAHIGEATLFLMELDYCGLFQIVGLSEQDTEAALLIECPRMLFPFARRLVADVTREGGFPPLLIDPVDFVQLYRQQKQRAAGAPMGAPAAAGASAVAGAAAPQVAPPAVPQAAQQAAPSPAPEAPAPQATIPAAAPAEAPVQAPAQARSEAPSETLAPTPPAAAPTPAAPPPAPATDPAPTPTPAAETPAQPAAAPADPPKPPDA